MSTKGHNLDKPNYDGLESLLLHTKLVETVSLVLGEDLKRGVTIFGHGGHVECDQHHVNIFLFSCT